MKINEDLTLQFDQADAATWYKLIEKELKGKPFDETLLKQAPEGIIIKPYYTKDDLTETADKFHDFLLQAKPTLGWDSAVTIFTSNFDEAKLQLALALSKGAESIYIEHAYSDAQLQELLTGVEGEFVKVYVNYKGKNSDLQRALASGGTYFDPIGNALLTGDFNQKLDAETLTIDSDCIKVDARYLQWAGANAVEELAYTLAWSLEYLLAQKQQKGTINSSSFLVNFSTTAAYFQEIAKLRAFRILWDMLLRQEAFSNSASGQPRIHVETARHQFGSKDLQSNILRSAMQAMAAVSGLADSCSVVAFDAAALPISEFSHRIAANIHYMLKYEAHLDKVNDPLGGSFYIESLTQSFVEKAWQLFESIENKGGFVAACKSGELQAKLSKNLQKHRAEFESGKSVFIGENKYQVAGESHTQVADFLPQTAANETALKFEQLTPTTNA